ncbi:unnamed protein product [Effrenium voratum]|uniref:RRM domain-containing protein n=1 Tax=Effrenium voratum TaxID=2562239 RepID=A0AA36N8L9_9DINO|nr:unnamed protein product [Effrenium voratum]
MHFLRRGRSCGGGIDKGAVRCGVQGYAGGRSVLLWAHAPCFLGKIKAEYVTARRGRCKSTGEAFEIGQLRIGFEVGNHKSWWQPVEAARWTSQVVALGVVRNLGRCAGAAVLHERRQAATGMQPLQFHVLKTFSSSKLRRQSAPQRSAEGNQEIKEEAWLEGGQENKEETHPSNQGKEQTWSASDWEDKDEKSLRKMHEQIGIAEDDMPISIKFLPSKDQTGETCSCIARYEKEETLEQVILRLNGQHLKTRSGKPKLVGVSKARPARWMVEAGLAAQQKRVPTKVSVANVPLEYSTEDFLVLHKEVGLDVDELPSVAQHPPKSERDETYQLTAKYPDLAHARKAVEKLTGALMWTSTGKEKRLSVWIVDPKGSEVTESHHRFEEGDLEGILEHWYEAQDYGFIRAKQGGPKLVAFRSQFVDSYTPIPGVDVVFEAFDAGKKYEARNIRMLNVDQKVQATVMLPAPTAEIPVQYEAAPGLDYFCKMWDLGPTTAAWLTRLHPEVQQAVIENYDDSSVPELLDPDEQITLHPSCFVAVDGLHRNISPEALSTLFGRFGQVQSCSRPNSVSAIVEMSSAEEASVAVQDLIYPPLGWPGGMLVHFHHKTPVMQLEDMPLGQRLFGIVKTWSVMGAGYIALHGTGPDLPVTKDCLEDVTALSTGAPVLFKAWQTPELPSPVVTHCMGRLHTVRAHLIACFGRDFAVRSYARQMQEHQGPLLKLLQSGEAPAVQLKRIKAQRPKAKSKAKAKASVKSLEGETVEAKGKEQEAVKATSNVEPAVQREAPIPTRPLAVPGRVALDLDD